MTGHNFLKHWEENAESWTALTRAGYDLYRDVLNTPEFLAFLPDVVSLTGLDIGCGKVGNTRFLAKKGAKMCSLDFAPTFISYAHAAKQQTPLNIEFHLADSKNLPFVQAPFDFAVVYVSLMDVDDTDCALGEAHRILITGGFLLFSILHPCFSNIGSRKVFDDNGDLIDRSLGKHFNSREGEKKSWTFGAAFHHINAQHQSSLLHAFIGQFQAGLTA